MNKSPPGRREAQKKVSPLRIDTSGAVSPETVQVAVEAPVTIDILNVDAYSLLCTPVDLEYLAVGFSYSEGIIASASDIEDVSACFDDPNLVRLTLSGPARRDGARRNLVAVSSCGLCGRKDLAGMLTGLGRAGEALELSLASIKKAVSIMRGRQTIFDSTGGTHAAALFDSDAEPVAMAEDIGRHTAFDKAIGKCLMSGRDPAGLWATLSGRASFELVAKAARAGLELLAAVSAPSSLAVEAADASNITLCAFVREQRATLYSHPGRVVEARRA